MQTGYKVIVIGQDRVATKTYLVATKYHTLQRKISVVKENTDWLASAGTNAENSKWIVLPKDVFDNLGSLTQVTNGNLSDNANVTKIEIDKKILKEFDPIISTYKYELPVGTKIISDVNVATEHNKAIVEISKETNLNGSETDRTTIVKVTSENSKVVSKYYFVFVVLEALNDATLTDLQIGNITITGFTSDKLGYSVIFPFGTTKIPTVKWIALHKNAEVEVNHASD